MAGANGIANVPGGVALVNGTWPGVKFDVPFVYGYYAYVAEGKVLVDPAKRRAGPRAGKERP